MVYSSNITILNGFQKTLDEPNHKPSKTLVGKGSEFYKRSIKSWMQDVDLEMHLTLNEVIFFVAERFIRILKTKICKYFSFKKCVY